MDALGDPCLGNAVGDHEESGEEQQEGPVDLREHFLRRLAGEREQERGARHRGPGEVVPEQEAGENERESGGAEQRQLSIERRRRHVDGDALPGKVPPERDQQHSENGGEREQRREQQRFAELRVGNAAQGADQHVLRIAGERRDGSCVGRKRKPEQIGERGKGRRLDEGDHQRRAHHADGIVHQQRRERSRDQHEHREQRAGTVRAAQRDPGDPAKDSCARHHAGDHHHAEQQDERVPGDRVPVDLCRREDAERDHRHPAGDCSSGPIELQERQLRAGEEQVRRDEDDQRCEHLA